MQIHLALFVARQAPEVLLHLREGTVHINTRVVRVIRAPHRNGATPVAVAGNRPVASAGKPVAEDTVLNVRRRPFHLLIELHHAVAEGGDLHEPRRHRFINERLAATPAVRIGVHVLFHLDQNRALGFGPARKRAGFGVRQVVNDGLVSIENLLALVIVDLGGKATALIHRHHGEDSLLVAHVHIVLAESGSGMHQASTILGGHKIRANHVVGLGAGSLVIRAIHEVIEDGCVGTAHQIATLEAFDHLRLFAQLSRISGQSGLRDHKLFAGPLALGGANHQVVNLWPHRDGQVRRERPRRRRPHERQLAGLQAQAEGDRQVLAVLVDVIIHT